MTTIKPQIKMRDIPVNEDETGKSRNPVMPDDGSMHNNVSALVKKVRAVERLTDDIRLMKAELRASVLEFHYQHEHGNLMPAKSVQVNGNKTDTSLVVFADRLSDVSGVETIYKLKKFLGDKFDRYFSNTFVIKVEGSMIPVGKQQKVVDDLNAVFQKHGCARAISAKRVPMPTETFFRERHTVLTVADNLKIERVAATVTSVKT